MMKRFLLSLAFVCSLAKAQSSDSIFNPSIFSGMFSFGFTAGAPLFVSSDGSTVQSGEPSPTYIGVAGSTSVATATTFANISGLVTANLTGTFMVTCRTTIAHTTNNANVFMVVADNGVSVDTSLAQGVPFIQGGVTPSLAVPMPLITFAEVTLSGEPASCMWRTSAGTAQSTNSRGMKVERKR